LERLFKALIPTDREDPFGEIEKRLIDLGNALLEGDQDEIDHRQEVDKYQAFVKGELESIKNRTFGIMVLQIFRTIKFFFGLLPQGRIILLLIAGMGLATTLLQGEKPSLSDIRAAVQSTGIGNFIDKIMDEIEKIVSDTTLNVETLADEITSMFRGLSSDTTFLERELNTAVSQLQLIASDVGASIPTGKESTPFQGGIGERLAAVVTGLESMSAPLEQAANVASNGAVFLPAILRGIEKRIRSIPEAAAKLAGL